jgi:transketolase
MRKAFIAALEELAAQDSRVTLLTGDLGFRLFEPYGERFPSQYFNMGVCEQNMMGVAAGLALEGKVVFVYSIGNFPSLRCLEQFRNDVCYHSLNVNIVCQGGGFTYGTAGFTHHATEDLSIMRALPGVTVTAPFDSSDTRAATMALARTPQAGYLRLEKEQAETPQTKPFELGRATTLREGNDIAIIGCGGVLHEALAAAEILAVDGTSVRVINMHTIKPLDEEAVRAARDELGRVLVVEENSIFGGLGGAVAELLATDGVPAKFARLGIPERFVSTVGSQRHLRGECGLLGADIALKVKELVQA